MSDDERLAAEIYRDWEEVLQHLREAPTGSPEAKILLAEMERLRLEYAALVEETRDRVRRPPKA